MVAAFARKPASTSVQTVVRETLDSLCAKIKAHEKSLDFSIDELFVFIDKSTGQLVEAVEPSDAMKRRPLRWPLRFKLKYVGIETAAELVGSLYDVWLRPTFNAADKAELFAALDWLEFGLLFPDVEDATIRL